MSQVLQAACPGCGRVLRIPSELAAEMLRCKYCGQVMRSRARPSANTAKPPTPAPAAGSDDADNPYLTSIRERRARQARVRLFLNLGLVAGAIVAAVIFRSQLADLWGRVRVALGGPAPAEVVPAAENPARRAGRAELAGPAASARPGGDSPAAVKNDGARDFDRQPVQFPGRTGPKVAARFQGRFPGRALLIGVKNYLYLSPLNPAYRASDPSLRDPIGLAGLRQVLVKQLGFPDTQVAELSDTAQRNPLPPLKKTIEENIGSFLSSCRPQDRALIAFVGHAVEVEGKGYLVPLEGDLNKVETLIPVSWLLEQLGGSPAGQKLLLLDLAHRDSEHPAGTPPLGAKLFEQLQKPPAGVQVWLSCSAGEHSHESASMPGSVFFYYLQNFGDMTEPENRQKLEAVEAFKEGGLPLPLLAADVARETSKYVKDRWNAAQTPRLLGSPGRAADPAAGDPGPPPLAIKSSPEGDRLADPRLIEGIVQELAAAGDAAQPISVESLPPFWAKALEGYQTDYATPEDLKRRLPQAPLRRAVLEGIAALAKQDVKFRMGYRASANDAEFKKMVEREQMAPASVFADLSEALEKLEAAGGARDQEPAKRWRAHYDFVLARLLAKVIWVQEYNFAVGNRLRKDTPVIKDKKNNGWAVVPNEKLQQKETRELDKKRRALLDRLIKENPETPWAILARREQGRVLGMDIQEAKVE